MARPTKICERHITVLEEYLENCVDEYEKIMKSQSTGKVNSKSWEYRLKAKFPTYAGLCLYYDKTDKENREAIKAKTIEELFIDKSTIDDWKNKGITEDYEGTFQEMFSNSIRKLLLMQEQMLLEGGTSGNYNLGLAKLQLAHNHGYRETVNVESEGDTAKAELVGKLKDRVDELSPDQLNVAIQDALN